MKPNRTTETLYRFFAGLTEYAFEARLGVADTRLIDYVTDLLARFVRYDALVRREGLPIALLAARNAILVGIVVALVVLLHQERVAEEVRAEGDGDDLREPVLLESRERQGYSIWQWLTSGCMSNRKRRTISPPHMSSWISKSARRMRR